MLAIDAESGIFAVGEARAQLPRARRWSWRTSAKIASKADRLKMELTFPRFIGAAENYLVMHLTRCVKPGLLAEVAPPDPPDDITKKLRSAVRDLRKLQKMWVDEFRLTLADLDSWDRFRQKRAVRNVLIHRLGRWEPGLNPQDDLSDKLTALRLNPATYRGEFPLSVADSVQCADLVLRLISEVEARLGRA